MSQYGRLDLAKEAAETVINTLGADSFVNVVAFSETARALMPDSTTLVRATSENIAELVSIVQDLEFDLANVATNFGSAFETTFDLIDESLVTEDMSTDCQTAIVFLTDGKDTVGASTAEDTAKQIACDTGGIYEHVDDGGDLSQAMAFFYRYYAIGLGNNEDFVTVTDLCEPIFCCWRAALKLASAPPNDDCLLPLRYVGCGGDGGVVVVGGGMVVVVVVAVVVVVVVVGGGGGGVGVGVDTFATNADLGFTIAAPVYDTNTTQPVFLGVVAMDFKVQTFLDQGYTVDEISEAIQSHNEWCPELSLTPCQRQTCEVCTAQKAKGIIDHRKRLEYTQRTCCGSNYTSTDTEPSCSLNGDNTGTTSDEESSGSRGEVANIGVGLAGGVAVAVVLILAALYVVHRRKKKIRSPKRDRNFTVEEAVGPPENAPRDLERRERKAGGRVVGVAGGRGGDTGGGEGGGGRGGGGRSGRKGTGGWDRRREMRLPHSALAAGLIKIKAEAAAAAAAKVATALCWLVAQF
eukprot:jgi/Undpi1/1567/HiC_scaffold_11.g04957.m1